MDLKHILSEMIMTEDGNLYYLMKLADGTVLIGTKQYGVCKVKKVHNEHIMTGEHLSVNFEKPDSGEERGLRTTKITQISPMGTTCGITSAKFCTESRSTYVLICLRNGDIYLHTPTYGIVKVISCFENPSIGERFRARIILPGDTLPSSIKTSCVTDIITV